MSTRCLPGRKGRPEREDARPTAWAAHDPEVVLARAVTVLYHAVDSPRTASSDEIGKERFQAASSVLWQEQLADPYEQCHDVPCSLKFQELLQHLRKCCHLKECSSESW
jgi:hypothetical protein